MAGFLSVALELLNRLAIKDRPLSVGSLDGFRLLLPLERMGGWYGS